MKISLKKSLSATFNISIKTQNEIPLYKICLGLGKGTIGTILIPSVMYRYNNFRRETSNADMIEINRNIERLEQELKELTARLRG